MSLVLFICKQNTALMVLLPTGLLSVTLATVYYMDISFLLWSPFCTLGTYPFPWSLTDVPGAVKQLISVVDTTYEKNLVVHRHFHNP